jgi:methionyl-tRNA formyltransferase
VNILIFGTGKMGEATFHALRRSGQGIVGVVTKGSGRGEESWLAREAKAVGIPVFQPENLRDPGLPFRLSGLAPDLLVVAGAHEILPQTLLELPKVAAIHLHLSLLPRGRGPCPWKWVLARGEARTGVTLHRMTERPEEGPILAQREVAVEEGDTGESLFLRLIQEGADLLVRTLERWEDGDLVERPQEEARATYDPAPTPADTWIDWRHSAFDIRNRIRGFWPRPGAWSMLSGRRILLRGALATGRPSPGEPGVILGERNGILAVTSGDQLLEVDPAGLEGFQEMPRRGRFDLPAA